jgi:hypothetical protein
MVFFKEPKKTHTPIGFWLPQKKISARYNKVSIIARGGGKFCWFLALGTPKTTRRRPLGILCVRQILLYSSRSVSIVNFISFRSAIPSKHRKARGGLLKIN